MTVFDIFKMLIEALFPREYLFYFGGTIFFILILDPLLNKYGSQKNSSNIKDEDREKFDQPHPNKYKYPM